MILVVASHAGTRAALASLIAGKGYPVSALDCGDEVYPRLRFQPPSLVILDCDWTDSFEMLAKIRSEPRMASIPVVMYSESGANVREKALGKGAHSFVSKRSLDWSELLAEIQRFVAPPTGPQGE